MAGLAIKNLTRRRTAPHVAFTAIAANLLPHWDISLVFVSSVKARELNRKLRNKDYTPNVLSYTVGEKSGEIIICPATAQQQAPDYQLSTTNYLLFLFIHGALHIKGWVHGARMEKCEQELLATIIKRPARSVSHGTTNSNRHRYRHIPSKSGGGRGTLR